MPDFQLTTPVAMLVFNRPAQTARVFEAVRQARPPILLLVADGPRASRPGEDELCRQTRQIVETIDWPCDVRKLYADVNLGCKGRVASGVKWVFEQVEEAIVLEDDCLPHPTYFQFCQELLARYRHDPRIYMICGHNFLGGKTRTNDSYYFSKYTHVWGWASWRRAIRLYDPDMTLWPAMRDGGWLVDILGDEGESAYWRQLMEMTYDGRMNTWDYQMFLACWANNLLTIIPNVNLISNIGFGEAATHTASSDSDLANTPVRAMEFPLRHPPLVVRDTRSDRIMRRAVYAPPSLLRKIKRRLRKWGA